MVPRKPISFHEKKFSIDVIFSSLNTPPYERTTTQIDSIASFLINSPEFLKIANTKRGVRELAKNVELEFYNPNSILFSIGDDFDGIYFIYKGEVAIIREKEEFQHSNSNKSSNENESPDENLNFNESSDFNNILKESNSQNRFTDENDDSTSNTEENSPIFSYQRTEIQPPNYSIPFNTSNLLQCKFGFGKNFEVVELKKSNSIIGASSNEIGKQKPWSFTAVVTEPSYFIRIDSTIYRKTIEYLRTEEEKNIAKYLEEIFEFDPILDRPELLERMSKDMKTVFVPKGTKRHPFESSETNEINLDNSWFVIKSGSVSCYRIVDFDQISIDKRALFVGSIEIKPPKGRKLIKTETYGPRHCLADPTLNNSYELRFFEDTTIHVISYDDIKVIIPYYLRKIIEKSLLNVPSEDELIREWCEKEMAIKWQMFRNDISHEAKVFALNEKIMMTGEVTCRKPLPPKQIKDHYLACKNPRFHACKKIEKSKENAKVEFAPTFRLQT